MKTVYLISSSIYNTLEEKSILLSFLLKSLIVLALKY